MTFTEFKNIVENFQQYLNKCSKLHQEVINIYNSDLYKPIVSAFYDLFESKFDEDRRNTLHWYINDANPEDCNIRELYALIVLNKDMYNDPVNGRYFELNSEEIQQLYNS